MFNCCANMGYRVNPNSMSAPSVRDSSGANVPHPTPDRRSRLASAAPDNVAVSADA